MGGTQMAQRRYQHGSVTLSGRRWILRWREDILTKDGVNRVHRKVTLGTTDEIKTKPLARRAADAILMRAGVNALDYRPGRVSTFAEFADSWGRDAMPMMKPSAQASARSHLNRHLVPLLGNTQVDAIGAQVKQGVIRALVERGLSRKSIGNVLMTLAGMMSTAKAWGYNVAPGDGYRLPPEGVRVKPRRFTAEEVRRIVGEAEPEWRVMLMTIALTGIRIGELLGLRWEDVDFEAGIITVRQSVWRGKIQAPKSDRSVRTLPLPRQLSIALEWLRRAWIPNSAELLWANSDGEPHDADNLRKRIFHPILARAGVEHGGFHGFRHMQGTLLVKHGANPKIVQAQLGHSDVRTTLEFYADVIAEDHRKAVASVADSLFPDVPASETRLVRVK